MKSLFKKYKSVLKFIITFLLVYGVLTIGYNFYLNASIGSKYYPDYVTHLVAKQSETLLEAFGYRTRVEMHPDEPSMKLIINNKFVARVVEGCNSLSVIILFVSFLIAFSGRPKTTFFYAFSGSVLIYAVNIVRIAVLSVGLYHYPWRRDVLHTVIFPLVIYGLVFVLWMVWVKWFSTINKKNE